MYNVYTIYIYVYVNVCEYVYEYRLSTSKDGFMWSVCPCVPFSLLLGVSHTRRCTTSYYPFN